MRIISILLAALYLLSSCGNSDKAPTGLLKPEKMQAVLWDVIKADVFTTNFIKKDSLKNAEAENLKLQQQIFAIHKTTKADFYSSYEYYRQNTAAFKKIVDSMIAQAERNKNVKPQLNTQVKAYE
ncbi:MAG: DUF4296 domain-containing protein [Ferruginibacter sp.]|nr:DUF4296 domain-containing protein [Ferruginibacter sp.]